MIPDTAMPPQQGQQEAPPHIEFDLRSVEDRDASLQAGRTIMKDKEFCIIYPRGGKDSVEKAIPEEKNADGYPNPAFQEFKAKFGRQYDVWKEGRDAPVEGTDLRNFPLLTPSQMENCRAYHIFTVEQLAEASEEALANIGLGSRKLKMDAQKWLEFGDNGGKSVTRLTELEADNQLLKDQLAQVTAKLTELEEKKAQDVPLAGKAKGPGRPKKG